ncbi:tryptophan--tRNA ligase [Nocardioides sp. C4-1]|uniref:tryptophan--tRNA ligase n=1 Tax=Nocardioides sp. C4-1 TaxID=3151851 RepID=UPI003263A876
MTSPTRTLSLLTPSGHLTLGSLLGALAPMRERQDDAFYGIADLHAMTTDQHDPGRLRAAADEMAALFLALGLDRATLFRQSHVPAHAQLAYLLECVATTGELGRMTQFKEKSKADETRLRGSSTAFEVEEAGLTPSRQRRAEPAASKPRGVASTRVSLFTYPALMAADILLYAPRAVPVGADQKQHVELTRDLALRFNRRYGEVFVVPEVVTADDGSARVMDLAQPTRKMSKSAEAPGTIYLLDPPDVVRRKVGRAVTDGDVGPDAVRRDREAKPGVTNLLEVLVACGGSGDGLTTYGALKRAVTDAVVATLEPIQKRYADLADDPEHVRSVFADGAARARSVTEPVLAAAQAAMGL